MGEEAVVKLNQTTQSGECVSDSCNPSLNDKKKKRRSRRTKQNSTSPVDSSISRTPVGEILSSGENSTLSNMASHDHQLQQSHGVELNSLPNMLKDEQKSECGYGRLQNPQNLVAGRDERLIFNSCPETIGCSMSEDSNWEAGISSNYLSNGHTKRKFYSPHWPEDVVTKALENGNVFKAIFRVNAYNKFEAYCKIDGLTTDILIYGLTAQNRAIDGDVVAIRVDHLSRWSKMKGGEKSFSNDDSLCKEAVGIVEDNPKGKYKKEAESNYANGRNSLTTRDHEYCDGENFGLESVGSSGKGYFNGASSGGSNNYKACSSNGDQSVDQLAKLCAAVCSFPSKRPTGRVVCILEMSPRRDTVVGFLGVQQFIRSRDSSKKIVKRNMPSSSALNSEHIVLTPTEPKFPRMLVPLRNLPNCLKKRLEAGDATVGMDLVAARVICWEEETTFPEAQVTTSFGRGGEIEAQTAAILFENAINSSEFSPEALSCLPPDSWEVSREELGRRKDLRSLCVFTIDPSTATDLDDALSVETLSDGTSRVGVHIADVSYFVLPDTALDSDAQIRSTSVYMLQRKLPMLPPVLSENLGSLNPGVDRLAFSIFWEIDPDGVILDRWIGRTVIHSCCKLSYEHAQIMLSGLFDGQSTDAPNGWPDLHGPFQWSQVVKSVRSLHEISRILRARRFNDGALLLQSPKVAFLFDEDGIPYDSVMSVGEESNFLVEEFMLLANRTAAEVITRAYPCNALLRRHPEPNRRKLKEFEAFCNRNGFKLDVSSSGQFHRSLECIRGELKDDSVLFDIVMMYATKPMQLASYFCSGDSQDEEGDWSHYGLGIPIYTHFTSPLRRYPDIVVHRMLAATVEAEEMYLKHQENTSKKNPEEQMGFRCFTGVGYFKEIVESSEAQELLCGLGFKYKVPCKEIVSGVASHCNNRKLAARHVKDAIDKLYMWTLLRKKEILCVEARVMGLGPRFMSIYIPKLAVERRIYYDDVESLTVEWLDATSTLVLSRHLGKNFSRKGNLGKFRRFEEVALVDSPCDSSLRMNTSGQSGSDDSDNPSGISSVSQTGGVTPAVFPLTLRFLSTIPVALHAIGGGDGPVDIGARLFVCSYFK